MMQTKNFCGNGAACMVTTDREFVCLCVEGFVGRRCERRDPCLDDGSGRNGGTCNRTEDGFVCSCPIGFAGMDLE